MEAVTSQAALSRPSSLVGPARLAAASLVIFLFAWVFPPPLYMTYIHEDNLLFLSISTLLFFLLCYGGFLVGTRLIEHFGNTDISLQTSPLAGRSVMTLNGPLIVGSIYSLIYLSLSSSNVDLVGLLTSQQGELIKLANISGSIYKGQWSHSLSVLTVILWWAAYRRRQMVLDTAAAYSFRICYIVSTLVLIATCVARLDRGSLIPALTGQAIVYFHWQANRPDISRKTLILRILVGGGAIISLFLLIAFARGAGGSQVVAASFIGYTIASYNRLAALVQGTLHYPTEGTGVYLANYLQGAAYLNDLFHFREIFQWPTLDSLLLGEFLAVHSAGLNPIYNWASFFGYLFSDIGWYSPFYMAGVGALTGYIWKLFCRGRTVGIVLYPWFGYSVLFWFGSNVIFEARLAEILTACFLLHFYEKYLDQAKQVQPLAFSKEPDAPLSETATLRPWKDNV